MADRIYRFSQAEGGDRVRVKLVGLGSAGCNMLEGAQFPKVAVSSSPADLDRSSAQEKLLIGVDRLVALSQASHSVLKHVPSVAGHEVFESMNNADMVFLMCGLGGVSGSLGLKLFNSIAHIRGVVDVSLVASPFSAESIRRRNFAQKALREASEHSSLCVAFDNDKLSTLAPNLPMSRAFGLMNGIMLRPVIDMAAALSKADLPVMRQALADSRYGRFGLGLARGDDRVVRVVEEALSSPWFDFSLKDSKIAIAIYSASDPWDKEGEKIIAVLSERLGSGSILWGMYSDASLGERIRLSLVLCPQRSNPS